MQVPRIGVTSNTLTTRGPGQTTNQKNTTGEVVDILGKTVQNIGEEFQRADLLFEKTKAENSYNSRMADIEQRAAQDNDTSPEKQKAYHDEINQAASDSSSFIKTPSEQKLFSLELQGKSNIAKMNISNDFQKKKIKETKDNIEIYLQQAQDDFIKSNDPRFKASSILERNNKIKEAVDANLLTPSEAKLQIVKLDHDWGLAQVNYDITTNPDMAKDGLKNKEYANISEEDRVDLLKKSNLAIKQKTQEQADQIELSQISNESNYLSKFANGEAGWMTISDIASDVRQGIIPEKFGSAYADVIKAQGEYQPQQPENENYPAFIDAIYKAKDKKELQNSLLGLLKDHKNISQEKLSVLINGALQRGNALSLRPAQIDPKQQEVDSAAMAVTNFGRRAGMSSNQISDIYQNYNKDVSAGKTPKEAYENAINAHVVSQYPAAATMENPPNLIIDSNSPIRVIFPRKTNNGTAKPSKDVPK